MPFVLTIALAAFLSFQVEFILARALLPMFGGTPAVWTTALLFFQVALLGGYAWAWWLSRRPLRRQWLLQALLAAAALLALAWPVITRGIPLLPDSAGDAVTNPGWMVGRALAVGCGLPFVLLTTTSPLVQSWAARQSFSRRPVLQLYAVSNLGSLLGLLGYPFAVEPLLDLRAQAWGWCALFLGYLVCLGLAARRAAVVGLERGSGVTAAVAAPRSATTVDRALWLLLPAVASGLMLAVSNSICQDVAVVPLLWVAPLAVYLGSFILPFHHVRWVPRGPLAVAGFAGGVGALFTLLVPQVFHAPEFVAVQLALLGSLALLLHGELARLAPAPDRLPVYYLWVAAGGALGGVFVSVAAPALFADYWELPILLVAAGLLVGLAWWRDADSPLRRGNRWGMALLLGFAGLIVAIYLTRQRADDARALQLVVGAAAGVAVGAVVAAVGRPFRHGFFALAAGALLLLATETALVTKVKGSRQRLVARDRNFFGVVRVVDEAGHGDVPPRRMLVHGWINHGLQPLVATLRHTPGAYYGEESGVTRGLAALRTGHPGGQRIAVLGLGAGSIAALAEPGDTVRFYEINPAVIRFAAGPQAVFSYLADARGPVAVVEGDARRALEAELQAGRPGGFDLLVMDAFSGDSVPVHLLTLEAFATYARCLNPRGGLIAVNVTNRFLRLAPLLEATAAHLGWSSRTLQATPRTPLEYASEWVLLTPAPELLRDFPSDAASPRVRPVPWTDRSSSLLSVLR